MCSLSDLLGCNSLWMLLTMHSVGTITIVPKCIDDFLLVEFVRSPPTHMGFRAFEALIVFELKNHRDWFSYRTTTTPHPSSNHTQTHGHRYCWTYFKTGRIMVSAEKLSHIILWTNNHRTNQNHACYIRLVMIVIHSHSFSVLVSFILSLLHKHSLCVCIMKYLIEYEHIFCPTVSIAYATDRHTHTHFESFSIPFRPTKMKRKNKPLVHIYGEPTIVLQMLHKNTHSLT